MTVGLRKFKILITYYGWIALFIGLSTTALISYYIYSKNLYEDKLRFEYEADQVWSRIQYRMDQYEGALIQARAFFLSSDAVSRSEFHQYFERTKLLERFPGVQGLGLTVKIKAKDLAAHIANVRKEIPYYNVWPETVEKEYFSILYLEPMDWRNKRALGYNMYSEPIRHEAMKAAMDTGKPVLSGMVTLIQENDHRLQPGLNLYVPLYQVGAPLQTTEERRNALTGFIYGPFRTDDLFSAILKESKPVLDVEIFDGDKPKPENLLYDYDGTPQFLNPKAPHNLRLIKKLRLYGRDFTLHFTPLPAFKTNSGLIYSLLSALIGFIITILIYRVFMLTKKTQETLQGAINARDEFFSIASHELKTPLTSLKLQSQLIKRTLGKDPEGNKADKVYVLADQTERQTQRLERLVDDMLDISRIRTGRLTIVKEHLNLCDLVKDVVNRMKEQFSNIPGGTPAISFIECEQARGHWDRMRIEQVVTNLLSNAIKYGNEKEIFVEVQATSDKVYLKVKDLGFGIPSEFKRKIFDRFERAGMPTKQISGLGLGLYISEQIVRSHGGKIWVESELGRGSTFTVELPLHPS